MDEYVKEAEDVSFESGIGESYDKEWALKDQALRDGYEEGRQEGIADGRKEGIKEGRREIAKTMLQKGIDINTISECTGLTIEEIKIQNNI